MNPTIGFGQKIPADVCGSSFAMDLIGWDVQTVPEPATTGLLAAGFAGVCA